MSTLTLSDSELHRYSRQLLLENFTLSDQEKLKTAKVLIVGAGGLGCAVLTQLAAAGIGTLGIIDKDIVELSNLNRQPLFYHEDIGKPKAVIAMEKIHRQNTFITCIPYPQLFEELNALSIASHYDLIVDASDNLAARFLLDYICNELKIPWIYGAIQGFTGQLSVFNFEGGAQWKTICPQPHISAVENCEKAGVIGYVTSIIGALQANEAIKIITGKEQVLRNKIFCIDTFSLETRILKIHYDGNITALPIENSI